MSAKERESGRKDVRGRQRLSECSRGMERDGGREGGRRKSYREMFVGESTQGVAVKGFLEADSHSS